VEEVTMSDGTEDERVIRSVDELKTLIGQEISIGEWVELTQDMVDQFVASTSVDQSNLSMDQTIVPGYFLLSAGSIIGRGRRGITIDLGGKLSVNYGMNQVRFPAPVRVGQRVRVRSTLHDVEEIDHRAVQMTRIQTIEIEGEDEPACVAETLGRVYF
jgi:acyl dehydratase